MAKETLRDWFSKNDGKGWVDCKTGKPCGRKSRTKSKEDTQLVDQLWLSVRKKVLNQQ